MELLQIVRQGNSGRDWGIGDVLVGDELWSLDVLVEEGIELNRNAVRQRGISAAVPKLTTRAFTAGEYEHAATPFALFGGGRIAQV